MTFEFIRIWPILELLAFFSSQANDPSNNKVSIVQLTNKLASTIANIVQPIQYTPIVTDQLALTGAYISCATVYLAPGITKRSLFHIKFTRIKSSPNNY